MRVRRAVRQHKLDPQIFLVRSRTCFRGEAFSESEILRLSHREINFDRIQRRNSGNGPAGWANERADLELCLSRDAIDRRYEARKGEVNLCSLKGGLSSLDLGFGGFYAGNGCEVVLNRVVEILLGCGLLFRQWSVSLNIKLGATLHRFGVGKLSFRLRQLAFCLVQRRLKRPGVDFKKELSFLDERALLIPLHQQVPCYLGSDVGVD